ncbi:putative E3 ubiquitin-protein ligase RZFP34 [Camellia lanceoleosa]|uniref:E3 ubiquitin-protein ligase RZFP34 n=1 Tax=Camellia lanceoleosa TaxID=1840588 RepID=A0ACC0HVF8_9ERIC|nr:putative E3 ubiquitin-protein ligase RZFP34 [Camellia lanceoleosa]
MEKQIRYEFDFKREADTMERIRHFLHENNKNSPVMVPRVIRNMVTRSIDFRTCRRFQIYRFQNLYQIDFGTCMGRYFCETCKLFDDDTSKKQYHCNGCGICRIGGRENFFHCNKCRCCYSVLLKNSHPCVEGAMHNDCPVCFEYLFESRNDVTVMPCGHTIHESRLKDMHEHYRYACPICSKSVCDMSKGSVPPSHMPIATGLNPFPTYHSFKC